MHDAWVKVLHDPSKDIERWSYDEESQKQLNSINNDGDDLVSSVGF